MGVEYRQQCCRADLSIPGAAVQTVSPVKAISDSGADITIMSERVATQLQNASPAVSVITPMTPTHPVRLEDGNVTTMQSITCLARTALNMIWGPVVPEICQNAIMSGADDVVIIGSKTTAKKIIDIYNDLGACAKAGYPSVRGVETPKYRDCRRVSIAEEELQHKTGQTTPINPYFERLGSRGLDMFVPPEQELVEHNVALEEAVKQPWRKW